MRNEKIAQFLLFFVITLGVYLVFVDFAHLKFITADAGTYLNIAENIASHKGFVTSFNIYQFFITHDHPLWPYIPPLYPLLCSLVFMLHGGIEQVIKLNILILGINTALIFYIIQTLVPSRFNLLFLIFLLFSFNFYHSALFPWTEQFHLLLFLISFILFLRFSKQPRWLGWLGIINGVLFLIRVSQTYSILAYLLVILVTDDKIQVRLKNAFIFTAGFMMVFVPYQLFNCLAYHSFFPQYIKPAAEYSLAGISNLSTYRPGVLGIYNPLGIRFSMANIRYFYEHLIRFGSTFFLFLIPVLASLSPSRFKKEERYFILNCLCQSAFIVIGYSLGFSWQPKIEALRYSLIPFILIGLAGWLCFYKLFLTSAASWKKFLAVVILVNLAFFSVYHYGEFRQRCMTHLRGEKPYFGDLYGSYRWIDHHLPEDILISSDEDQEAYFMHRPFISMPPGESFNCINLSLYDRMYSPDFYLLSSSIPDNCFTQMTRVMIFSNETFRILEIKRNK